MQNFNHVSGGFAFTGIFASFADVNIFEHVDVMAVVWVAAILPDIDHQKSIIGWSSGPLAEWIQKKYGHRTITHSIFFYLATVLIAKGIDNLFHLSYTLPIALALGSHLIFDMCTKQGIPLFYPFSRKPVVLPANPKLRVSANDYKSEAIIFIIFCCLNVFSYPLMAQGFWTRYNRGFATYDHLERETKRKPGDYAVMLLGIAENDTTVGLLVEQKPAELVLWKEKEKQFQRFETDKYKLLNFLKRSKGKHEFTTINLLQVSTDSLNTYMKLPVVKVTAQSDSNAIYYFEGPIMKKGTELTADYPNQARFQQLAIDNAVTNAELAMLDVNHKKAIRRYDIETAKIRKNVVELNELRNQANLSDYDEGKRRMRVLELAEQLKNVVQPEPVDYEGYQIRKRLLEHKLMENNVINASVLIWQVKGKLN